MKRNLLVSIFSAAAIMLLSSCQKGTANGGVSFAIGSDCEIEDVLKSKLSDHTTLPSAGAFTIKIKNSSSEEIWKGLVSDWSTATPLQVGEYSVEATYGTDGEEGFDKPYFTGSTNFTVNGASVTEVNVPVKLANCIVKVSCTQAFKNYFSGYSFKLTTGAGTVMNFGKDEATKAAFMDAFKFTVDANLINQGAQAVTFPSKTYEALQSATCYTLLFDASQTGGNTISISFNDTVETVDLGEIEIN